MKHRLPVVYGTPGKPPAKAPKATTEHPETVAAARKVIERIMLALRWKDQGGYPGRNNGQWDFVATGLPMVEPAELDVLMAFAGIIPDEIKSKGECTGCKHAIDGRERGYVQPCSACTRPYHSHFEPKED